MKWNIIIGSLVLSLALSTQSYGFELLDRMLGLNGCGCEAKSCETKADAKCGAEKDKKGCDAKKSCHRSLLGHLGCDAKKCDAKDKCGAEKNGCDAKKRCHGSLLGHHGCDAKNPGKPNNSKNTAEAKGKPVRVEQTKKCGSGKEKKKSCSKGCLLDHILSLGHGCDEKKDDKCGAGHKKRCGCDAKSGKGESSAEVTPPTPPAPVVDPSALLPSQRRVVHTSLNTLR